MNVAVAIIMNEAQEVLLTRRAMHVSHGGKWEFPGGKLEGKESPTEALLREIKEEIGVQIRKHCFLGEIKYTYDQQKQITFFVFRIDSYQGAVSCCESQLDLQWVAMNQLIDYSFPEANIEIIELIKRTCFETAI